MSLITNGLNEAQSRAVTTISGPVLIVAGPGTGKTLTLVRRIAHMVDQGVPPDEILAVTFTNRAAREMDERTMALLGDRSKGIFLGTFHLLGLRILCEEEGEDFGICGREEQITILSELTGGRRKAEQAAYRISRIKNFIEDGDRDTADLRIAYDEALKVRKLRDFDDLIGLPLRILEDREKAVQWRGRFGYIMVDEYQDINPAQYLLLRHLVDETGNICVVGDSDQAIYAFRGADLSNFLNFESDFPGAVRILLTTNYRSSKVIVGASSGLIKHNRRRIDKEVEAVGSAGPKVMTISVPDEKGEAETVIREIEKRMGGTSHYGLLMTDPGGDPAEYSYGFHDFAVICRTNAQVNAMEEVVFNSGIPYQIVRSSPSAWEEGVADALRAATADPAVIDLAELVEGICEKCGVPERDRFFACQLGAVYKDLPREEGVARMIKELTLWSKGDGYDPRAEAVTLMTLHMAKGLEFKVIFIVGAEEGLIPFTAGGGECDEEEERRLFYVGMTRAKEELVITAARERYVYGRHLSGGESPFIKEIPGEFMHKVVVRDRPKNYKKKQMKLF